jgi:hypothetical protein
VRDLLDEQQEHYRKLGPTYDQASDAPELADDRLLAGLPIRGDRRRMVRRHPPRRQPLLHRHRPPAA